MQIDKQAGSKLMASTVQLFVSLFLRVFFITIMAELSLANIYKYNLFSDDRLKILGFHDP